MSASQPAACAGHIRTSETRMNPPMPPDANRRNSIRVAAGNCGPARRGWWIGEPSLDQASRGCGYLLGGQGPDAGLAQR
jgi:hypothetical protein